MRRVLLWLFLIFISACGAVSLGTSSPEAASSEDVEVDFFHGDRVSDPYRWLESENASETEDWLKKQGEKTAAYFKTDEFDKVKEALISLEKQRSPEYTQPAFAGGRLFALKTRPPVNQPMIVAMPAWDRPEQEQVIVDPNLIDPSGATAIDWFVPSHNGKMLAVSMSKNDSAEGSLYIYELEKKPAGKKKKGKSAEADDTNTKGQPPTADDVIENVNHAVGGGSLVWAPDDKSFFYTRYPDEGGLSEEIYQHKIGTSSDSDKFELGRDFEKISRVQLEVDVRSGRVIASLQRGDAPEYSHYLRDPKGTWQRLSSFEDEISEIVFAPEGGMFVVARQEAKRGKVLYLPSPKVPLNQAKRLIPESAETIVAGVTGHRSLLVTANRLYVNYRQGGPSELRVFSHEGTLTDTIQVPDAAVDVDLVPMEREEILIPMRSYNAPPSWYRYDGQLGEGSLMKAKLSVTGIEVQNLETHVVTAVAADGAKLPITLVHKSGITQTGNNPTLMVVDGGFGSFLLPRFNAGYRLWLEQGGILAYAEVRGGGELGEDWHTAGRLTYKKNTFEDFYTCMAYLTEQKYTRPDKLAVQGKYAGALVAGVMLTRYPDAFKVAVASAGVYDMMRNEYTPGGEAAVPEFGTNTDEEQYKAMIGYSPYHHVPKKTSFPSTLLIAGQNDNKVAAWQTRKFAARLQAENSGLAPILIKSDANAGHGTRLPFMQQLTETAEILTFLFQNLDVKVP